MASRTLVKVRMKRKTNPQVLQTIYAGTKNKAWFKVAQFLSAATRGYYSVNLSSIDQQTTAGDTVLVLGKVLSTGELTKKVRICALSISASAKEKLKKTKSEFATLAEEIKINPKAEGLKIIQ